ncbi:extracellular solute-binding protein [Streptomyces sp. SID8379]|uniref:ABC transporter substrate-binding protein n=1 Tax=unclassified Streptomyces TaxID=2593676 RepID=UPI000361A6C9|nr:MULTISPECIES: ABC transporter substrate-binding protein [unclassified Streptomyces]MYW65888.1 extracellular solute-binding protein [Streptomyces sp. SID8379]
MGNDAPSRRPLLPRRTALTTLLTAGLGTALGGGLTGCSDSSRSVASGGTVTLRYFFWGDSGRADLINQCIAAFERAHPKIKVKSSFAAFDSFWPKLSTAAAGGSPPDVMHIDYAWIRTLGEHGVLADLNEHTGPGKEIDATTLVPSLRTAGMVEDRRVALPLSHNSVCLMYDAEVWADAGARAPTSPMSWDTFMKQSRAVTRHTGRAQFGMDNPGQNYMGVELWMRQQGRQMWTDKGELGFGEDDLVRYFTTVDAYREDGALAGPDVVLESLPGYPITTQRAASYLEWDNQVGGRSALRGTKLTLGSVPSDTHRSGLYAKPGMLMSAAAKSPYISEAAQFINFMINDRRVAKILGTNIGMPPTTSQEGAAEVTDPAVRQVQTYERQIAKTLAPTPPPPADGGASLNEYLRRVAEKLFYGRISADRAAGLFFDQAKVVLA